METKMENLELNLYLTELEKMEKILDIMLVSAIDDTLCNDNGIDEINLYGKKIETIDNGLLKSVYDTIIIDGHCYKLELTKIR